MEEIAKALVAPGKGIWAADASPKTIMKRFQEVGIQTGENTNKRFRETLFATDGLENYISGVILNDEIIREERLKNLLTNKGILIGVKVDKGTVDLENFPGEKITEGLDGLRERLAEYKGIGAKFTKWRAVITIGENIPTHVCIGLNVEALARFAALSQEADLVPIVEPEVLMDGKHTIDESEKVTFKVLKNVFTELAEHKVNLSQVLLKPNFVHHGKDCLKRASDEEIAQRTLKVLKKTVPPQVPGIVFLSGGDSSIEATKHVDRMNEIGGVPWPIAFSFERALEGPAMIVWGGKDENIETARQVLLDRAKKNSLARSGSYSESMES